MNQRPKTKNPKPFILFTLSFILLPLSFLFAENYMELIAELTGEHPRSEFGFCAANLDFNGDGIDDLAVGARKWDPEYPGWPSQANPWGKIYFYFGKEECFGDSIDFTISGYDSLKSFGKHLENLGDTNGDGFEDLGYRTYYYDYDEDLSHYFANILLGNDIMDSIPDYIYEFLGNEYNADNTPDLKWLGDINGDGYDDTGFVISRNTATNEDWVYLIYGNEFELHYFCQLGINNTRISGIGDVNNDGFDDFIIGYYGYEYVSKLLYFGGIENDSIPDIILTDTAPYPYYDTTGGIAIGDWNGDGIDDFNVGIDYYGPDIWFGSETMLSQQMHLNFYDWLVNRNNDFGDLNADGKDDFVAGNPGGMAGINGDAYVYLGCQNGTYDYHIEGDHGVGLGWSVAVGDFNNDNCDDIAVGGKGNNASFLDNCYCGKVYVYAGNPDLEEADPNIAVEEEIIPKPDVEFYAYPNPFNPSSTGTGRVSVTTISFSLTAEDIGLRSTSPGQAEDAEILIYNIKGQRVKTIPTVSPSSGHQVSVTWDGTDENGQSLPTGVYLYQLTVGEYVIAKKMVLCK